MHRTHLITYGIIAGVTPTLVLINSLLINAASSPSSLVQPLQSMLLAHRLMDSEPETLVTAYDFMPEAADAAPQAQIIQDNGQVFLEFYNPFHSAEPALDLILVLDQHLMPGDDFSLSQQTYTVGKLQPAIGSQRYSIPASVEVEQYLSVIIWCPELNAIVGYVPLTVEGSENVALPFMASRITAE